MGPVSLMWVIITSAILQVVAFVGACWVLFRNRSIGWFFVCLAFGLMAFRRMLSLWIHLMVTDLSNVSLPPEITAICISALLCTAVGLEAKKWQ